MTISITAKSRTLSNGTANDATPVEANFTELYNNDSTLATGINGILGTTSTNSAVDGRFLILRNSFSGSPGATDHAGLRIYRGAVSSREIRWNETNSFWEASHDGTNYFPISLVTSSDPASPINGYLWYNNTSHALKVYMNGAISSILTTGNALPKKYVGGPAPQYVSASSVKIPAGAIYRDDSDVVDLMVTSDLTVSLATSGALGLDTGSEASNTWYYLWLCKGASGITAIFSTSKTSPTLPTGYDSYKRRVRGAFRNDGSSNLVKFVYLSHALRAEVRYDVPFTYFVNTGPTRSSAGTTNILNAGTATSDTTLSATSNYVPPVSGLVKFNVSLSQSYARLFEAGTSNYIGIGNAGQSDANYNDSITDWIKVNSSQQIGYALPVTSGSLSLDVYAFLDTQED